MDAAGQLLGQRLVDAALALEAALAREGRGDDGDAEMRFAPRPRPDMARMKPGFVDDIEVDGLKRGLKLGAQAIDGSRGHGGHCQRVMTAPILVNPRAAMAAMAVGKLVLGGAASHTGSMSRFSMQSRRFDPADDAPPPPSRGCDHPGCTGTGEFRAPRSRTLTDYYWFCLEHVRSYNASWNYYSGMSEAEIEAELRKDMVGQRPSWRFGSRVAWRFGNGVKDFGLFDFEPEEPQERRRSRPPTPQEAALSVFELDMPFTLAALKARYKELVKRHHPDAHGGDKAAEERLKIINQAYSTLKASYFS